VIDTDFDLDDEPMVTAEGEVAAAICGHQVVMQRGDALTADMLDEFHGFVQEELAALLEEKNPICAPSPTASSPTPTGATFLTAVLEAKRLELLHELLPSVGVMPCSLIRPMPAPKLKYSKLKKRRVVWALNSLC
jgi:hypothetical protein